MGTLIKCCCLVWQTSGIQCLRSEVSFAAFFATCFAFSIMPLCKGIFLLLFKISNNVLNVTCIGMWVLTLFASLYCCCSIFVTSWSHIDWTSAWWVCLSNKMIDILLWFLFLKHKGHVGSENPQWGDICCKGIQLYVHIICLFYTAVVDVVLIVGRLDIMITSKMLYNVYQGLEVQFPIFMVKRSNFFLLLMK